MTYMSGSDLKKIRMLAGKTTKEMAHLAGVKTRKTYENWEKDISTPNFNQFMTLVECCGFEPAAVVAILMQRKANSAKEDISAKLLKMSR